MAACMVECTIQRITKWLMIVNKQERWLGNGTTKEKQLLAALKTKPKSRFIVVYDKPYGLNSAVFAQIEDGIDDESIRDLIWGKEALIYRGPQPAYALAHALAVG